MGADKFLEQVTRGLAPSYQVHAESSGDYSTASWFLTPRPLPRFAPLPNYVPLLRSLSIASGAAALSESEAALQQPFGFSTSNFLPHWPLRGIEEKLEEVFFEAWDEFYRYTDQKDYLLFAAPGCIVGVKASKYNRAVIALDASPKDLESVNEHISNLERLMKVYRDPRALLN